MIASLYSCKCSKTSEHTTKSKVLSSKGSAYAEPLKNVVVLFESDSKNSSPSNDLSNDSKCGSSPTH